MFYTILIHKLSRLYSSKLADADYPTFTGSIAALMGQSAAGHDLDGTTAIAYTQDGARHTLTVTLDGDTYTVIGRPAAPVVNDPPAFVAWAEANLTDEPAPDPVELPTGST